MIKIEHLKTWGFEHAMDEDSGVFAYTERPNKNEKVKVWQRADCSKMIGIDDGVYFGLSWEDEEATLIWDKIKEYQYEMFNNCFGNEIEEYERSVKKSDKVITNSDMVNSPNHYTWKARECRYIQADMVDGLEGMVASHMTNIIKYLYRVGHKDDIKQDLEKAKKNIDFIIEEMTGEK